VKVKSIRFAGLMIMAGMILSACGRDIITNSNYTEIDFGNGGGQKTGFTTSRASIDMRFGTCEAKTFTVSASKEVRWSTKGSVISASGFGTTVTVTVNKVGTDQLIATDSVSPTRVDVVIIPVTITACPTDGGGGGTTVTAGFISAAPSDTSMVINTRFSPRIVYRVPAGASTGVLVRSQGCVVMGTPFAGVSNGTANEYRLGSGDLVAIANNCSDYRVILKLVADTTKTATITVRVTALPGIKILPAGPISGPIGMTDMHRCQVTGLTDTRCWYYSTKPNVAAVVQKDTTFSTFTAPWGTGSHFGGEWRHIGLGTADICAFSPNQPQYADCAVHNVTSSTSGNVMVGGVGSSSSDMPSDFGDYKVPEIIRQILKIPARE
jgi:hypothetical protein